MLSVVLPKLEEAGYISKSSSGFVTAADFESLEVDSGKRYGSLMALAGASITLAGSVIWLLSVYGEGIQSVRYRLHKMRHKAVKETNKLSQRLLGYALISESRHHAHKTREDTEHEDERFHDEVNAKPHIFG